MKLEDVAILEDGNRFVASCKIDVDGHLFSLVLSNTLKQSEIGSPRKIGDDSCRMPMA